MSFKSAHSYASFKDILGFMWRYYGRYKWTVLGAFVSITAAITMALFNPFAYAWLTQAASTQLSGSERDLHAILQPILAIVALSIGHHFFKRLSLFINDFNDSHVHADIVSDSTNYVHHFETEWHASNFSGSMVTAIKRGRSAADTLFNEFCYEFWPACFVSIGTIALMFGKAPVLGAFFLIFALCYTCFSVVINRRFVMPYNRALSEEDSRLGGTIADSLSGHTVVKSFAAEKRENIRLTKAAHKWRARAQTAWMRVNMLGLSQNVVVNIGRFGALYLAALLWTQGTYSAADMIYVVMALRVLVDYLDNIGNNFNRVSGALNDIEEVVYWSLRRPKIASKPDAKQISITQGSIGFHRITFYYNEQGKPALTDFNLSIAPGEKIALVGPSGGGKSTVLKLLQRFYEQQQGIITVDGHDIQDVDLTSLRSAMALVPQDPILFHRTLADNIGYAQPNATLDQIKQAAASAQIATLINGLPYGYETLVGERGIKLSGGERQRVAIARAIIADTPILLLDEATSALDSECEEEIQKAIAEASKGRTMIAIAHRLSTIQSADRIIVLAQGRILEQGSHRELLAMPSGLYRRLYESQAKGFLPDHLLAG